MFLTTRHLLAFIPILILLTIQVRQTISFNKYVTTRRPPSHQKLSSTTTTTNNHNDDHHHTEYTLNVGKALDVLTRELPLLFAVKNLDFSILSSQITVVNGNQPHSLVVSKTAYIGAIRAIQMASTVSSNYPSIHLRKIEYIEDIRTIQCLVDVAFSPNHLISTVIHHNEQHPPVWEGMFYFGLNKEGLIDTHIFDRKISNLKPAEGGGGNKNCSQFEKLCNQ